MKIYDLVELLAVLCVVIGGCALVAAAVMVDVALGVAAAGVLLVFGGIVAVYAASQAEAAATKKREPRP